MQKKDFMCRRLSLFLRFIVNNELIKCFHSSHSAGVAGKGINTTASPITTTQSAPKPRVVPPQTSTQQTPRAPVVHPQTARPSGAAGVQSSNSMGRVKKGPPSDPRLQSASKPRGTPSVHEATYLQRGDQRTVESPITQSAPKPRVVPPQTSSHQTPRTPVVHSQTARQVASAVQPSSNGTSTQSAPKPRETPLVHEAAYLQKGDQRTVEISSSSTSKKRQHERLPPMDNNVIRQQEVTTQSPPSKRQNQSQQQLPPTPTLQQNNVGGQQQESQGSLTPQQNNGEILKFVQTISEQNDLVKEINHHYQIVVPEKMKMISEITEKLAKFAEAVKTRI
uniref:Uncharacterized protein n=1 Tax=Meloidogyne enterolobii TaxID=390850 RepID=A0A6V7UA54_MELEN|nr:unnamed protein product [Meloidogyne enterolobii]